MQRLWENCRAVVRARDWRQLAVAAVLILFGFGMLLRNYLPATSAERGELVEARVVARTVAAAAPISSGGSIIGSATVQSTAATGESGGAGDVVRTLQQGLRRAGCYDGPINGQWSRQSKEAMARFVTSVNAQLPVERAEPVLLALMDAHPRQTCGGQRTAQSAVPASAPAPVAVPASAPVAMRVEAAAESREPSSVRRVAAQEKKQPAALPQAPPPVHASDSPPVRAAAPSAEPPRSVEAPREALKFAPFALAAVPSSAAPVAAPVPTAQPLPAQPPAAAQGAAEDEAVPRSVRASRSVRRAYMAPRRYIVRHRSRAPSNAFARSVTRNVRALQRSLGMIVYY